MEVKNGIDVIKVGETYYLRAFSEKKGDFEVVCVCSQIVVCDDLILTRNANKVVRLFLVTSDKLVEQFKQEELFASVELTSDKEILLYSLSDGSVAVANIKACDSKIWKFRSICDVTNCSLSAISFDGRRYTVGYERIDGYCKEVVFVVKYIKPSIEFLITEEKVNEVDSPKKWWQFWK